MAWLLLFVIVAVYAILVVASYRRWRWFGPPLLALIVALGFMVWGTIEWRRPHTDPWNNFGFADWQCHSLDLVPSLLLFTAVGMLALLLVRAATTKWSIQLTAVGASFALAFFPAVLLLLNVGCDTL